MCFPKMLRRAPIVFARPRFGDDRHGSRPAVLILDPGVNADDVRSPSLTAQSPIIKRFAASPVCHMPNFREPRNRKTQTPRDRKGMPPPVKQGQFDPAFLRIF